ncbi:MAG: hypothetical protein N3F03_05305 [Ignavibacteria bacterium]|nr:hypothetical protein [Ignavibacteria bacterium]
MKVNNIFRTIDETYLRKETFLAKKFNRKIIDYIYQKELLRIWIPKKYDGLDLSLKDGLMVLQKLSRIDGSLGWFVTLTSGANYFSRNIHPEIASTIFTNKRICFGGSGMIGGTAKKVKDGYIINGYWRYATGAPHLTHFTFNAQIVQNGKALYNSKGEPIFLSFFVDKKDVRVIKNWNVMGLIATESHDFEIINKFIPEQNAFKYNLAFGNDLLDLIPFNVFAYLTLTVNYLGMAEHFFEICFRERKLKDKKKTESFLIKKINSFYKLVNSIEDEIKRNKKLGKSLSLEAKKFGRNLIEELAQKIIQTYQEMGIRGAIVDEEINQVFRDFFTATQHNIFKK